MESIKTAVSETVASVTNNAKIADLQKNTIDVSKNGSQQRTDHGVLIADADTWLKVTNGQGTGPSLLEDQIGREKIHRFDHERIPERVVHARGAGAHGTFKVYDDSFKKYTSAPVLTDSSRTTPVFMRFSTVQGSKGSADTVRDVRGFAVKHYTPEGNWDIVGNDIPVFFIQESIKFPDFVHSVKPEPQNEVPQGQSAHNNFWDFVGLQPEASHMIMWVMSDRGIPRSYANIQGFGVNTYTLMNAEGERFFVKFHYMPELGVHSMVWDEALKVCGQDPDFHRKGLEEAIKNGAFPKWFFGIQVIPEGQEHDFEFDILDATKVWPEELVPVQIIGELELNRVVDEYFPEVEQVAFCTSHVVPGIGFSDDPLLQGRNFSYFDTQISRLGINWEELPINRPVCPVMNVNRDGRGRHTITKGVNYHPNRFDQLKYTPPNQGGYAEYAQKVEGMKQRVRGAKFQEHYNQAQLFYNSLAPHEQEHLAAAISFELSHCDDPVVFEGYTRLLNNIDFELAKKIALNVGGIVPEAPARPNPGHKSAKLSQTAFPGPAKPTIKTRRIAILLADGFNLAEVTALRALIKSAMALSFVIGPRRGTIYAAGQKLGVGEGVWADHHYEGQRSTMFDAVIIPSGAEHAAKLANNGRVIHWVREAFGHLKTIGAIGEGAQFLYNSVQLPGIEVASSLDSNKVVTSYGVVTTGKYDVSSATTDALQIAPGETGFLSNFAYEVSKHRNFQREMDGLSAKVAY